MAPNVSFIYLPLPSTTLKRFSHIECRWTVILVPNWRRLLRYWMCPCKCSRSLHVRTKVRTLDRTDGS